MRNPSTRQKSLLEPAETMSNHAKPQGTKQNYTKHPNNEENETNFFTIFSNIFLMIESNKEKERKDVKE